MRLPPWMSRTRIPAAVLAGLAALCAHASEPVKPIPIDLGHALPPTKIALGETLFRDKRLSGNGKQSCASCHDLSTGGTLDRSTFAGRLGDRNPPTVFNAALDYRLYRDGRSGTLEEQFMAVIAETMAGRWEEILPKLRADGALVDRFKAVYGSGPTQANVADAVVTFERSLVTPNARFDRWLRGDAQTLSADERRGYALFKSYGCVACHQGMNVGGNMFQVFGALRPLDGRRVPDADTGRHRVTHDEADRFVFKVPGLRNVAITPPYLHDGSAPTLHDAVDAMFHYQLGRRPLPDDVDLIVKFLHTLTGEYQGRPLEGPPITPTR